MCLFLTWYSTVLTYRRSQHYVLKHWSDFHALCTFICILTYYGIYSKTWVWLETSPSWWFVRLVTPSLLKILFLMFLIFAITQLRILTIYHSFCFISPSPFRCTLVPCHSLQMDYSDFSTTSDLWDTFRWPISLFFCDMVSNLLFQPCFEDFKISPSRASFLDRIFLNSSYSQLNYFIIHYSFI